MVKGWFDSGEAVSYFERTQACAEHRQHEDLLVYRTAREISETAGMDAVSSYLDGLWIRALFPDQFHGVLPNGSGHR